MKSIKVFDCDNCNNNHTDNCSYIGTSMQPVASVMNGRAHDDIKFCTLMDMPQVCYDCGKWHVLNCAMPAEEVRKCEERLIARKTQAQKMRDNRKINTPFLGLKEMMANSKKIPVKK